MTTIDTTTALTPAEIADLATRVAAAVEAAVAALPKLGDQPTAEAHDLVDQLVRTCDEANRRLTPRATTTTGGTA